MSKEVNIVFVLSFREIQLHRDIYQLFTSLLMVGIKVFLYQILQACRWKAEYATTPKIILGHMLW